LFTDKREKYQLAIVGAFLPLAFALRNTWVFTASC